LQRGSRRFVGKKRHSKSRWFQGCDCCKGGQLHCLITLLIATIFLVAQIVALVIVPDTCYTSASDHRVLAILILAGF